MSFTYTAANISPANTVPDLVSPIRWLIQDTDSATAEVQDEEINGLLAGQDSLVSQLVKVYRVAAQTAQALARRYAKQASFSSGGTQVHYKERAEAWKTMAQELVALALAAEADADGEYGIIRAGRDTQFPLWITDWSTGDHGLDL